MTPLPLHNLTTTRHRQIMTREEVLAHLHPTKAARKPKGTGRIAQQKKRFAAAVNAVPVVGADGSVNLELPMRLVSLANRREHWTARSHRANEQRGITAKSLRRVKLPALPLVVVVTRIGKRKLDRHDNLRISAKHVIDGIADAIGIDDGDERVKYEVEQQIGADYAARINIRTKGK